MDESYMDDIKHKVIIDTDCGRITMYMTQKELANILQSENVQLVSVNETEIYRCTRKKKGR